MLNFLIANIWNNPNKYLDKISLVQNYYNLILKIIFHDDIVFFLSLKSDNNFCFILNIILFDFLKIKIYKYLLLWIIFFEPKCKKTSFVFLNPNLKPKNLLFNPIIIIIVFLLFNKKSV